MENLKIKTKIYGDGVSGHAVKTDKLKDCKKRYCVVSELIKIMNREKKEGV